jgi:(2Fe-2S) ferredoxin
MSDVPKKPVTQLRHHVFVCTNRRPDGHRRGCCASKGSEELLAQFKVKAAEAGLRGKVRVQKAGCLDTCEDGISVVVYPDDAWYGRVTEGDLDEMISEHLTNDRPLDRLRIEGK